jgi:hypothetical protein
MRRGWDGRCTDRSKESAIALPARRTLLGVAQIQAQLTLDRIAWVTALTLELEYAHPRATGLRSARP